MKRIALVCAVIAVAVAGCGKQPLGERVVEVCKAGQVMPGSYGTEAMMVTDDAQNWQAAHCYIEQAGFGSATWERVTATQPWDGEQTDTLGASGTLKAKWRVGTTGRLVMTVEEK